MQTYPLKIPSKPLHPRMNVSLKIEAPDIRHRSLYIIRLITLDIIRSIAFFCIYAASSVLKRD